MGHDNELRLKAFLTVGENPGISFNELARKLKVEKGLLDYLSFEICKSPEYEPAEGREEALAL